MAKKKLTALQKRMRKEAEKKERAAYESGKIKPAPSRKPDRQKIADKKASEQKRWERRQAQKRTAADVAGMNAAAVISDLMSLWNSAYHRYQLLKQAGISNAATAIYEQNFAGMNPFANSLNENRAMIAALKKWLSRRDVSVHRGQKTKRKMLQNLEKWGIGGMDDDEITEFWDLYEKYVEWLGGVPSNIVRYLEHFASAYAVYRASPDMSHEEMFEIARRKMEQDYENSVDGLFPSSSLGG